MLYACIIVTACLTLNAAGQQSGGPQDGDVRVAYDKDQRVTSVTLTLLPRSTDGKPTPTGMQLQFTAQFPDNAPKTRPGQIEVRAYAGLMWAPRPELWFSDDAGWKTDLGSPNRGFSNMGGSDYLWSTMPVADLEKMAKAKRVIGSALGLPIELTGTQLDAFRSFATRVLTGSTR